MSIPYFSESLFLVYCRRLIGVYVAMGQEIYIPAFSTSSPSCPHHSLPFFLSSRILCIYFSDLPSHSLTMFFQTLLPILIGFSTSSASPTPQKRDSWGGALSLGPTTSHILSVSQIIIPGKAPSTQNGELFLWPGISNGTGNLIQTTLESWPDNTWCGALPGEW